MTLELVAGRGTLETRARMLAAVRAFFAARGLLEVETPALSAAAATDPALHSLRADTRSLGTQYLHTSPELAMKRLLVAGSGDIYQLCRVFRDDELGRWHQPEFTLLEWYRLGFGLEQLMHEVRDLLTSVLAPLRPIARFRSLRYSDALREGLDATPDDDATHLAARLRSCGVDADPALGRDALLDLALGTVIAPSFAPGELTFIFDYPATQAALARLRVDDPRVAERFEAFLGPLEIANGFRELGDPLEQRRRFERENTERCRRGLPPGVVDDAFLAALAAGLPDCAGVAVGFDRLVAVAIGATELAGGLSLAHRRTPDAAT